MANIIEINHPLIQHKITMMRDCQTGTKEFRELMTEVSILMWYEVTRDLPVKEVEIQTPITTTNSKVISGKKLALVPILRSGITMADGIVSIMPSLKIGHIGVFRDPKTLMPTTYYCKLPKDIKNSEAIILDPMLATGGSLNVAIDICKENGASSVKVMSLLAAPEGIKAISDKHPDVSIYTCSVDEKLDNNGFIVPGFGDAGDRMFGTK